MLFIFADGDPNAVGGGKLAVLLTLATLGGGAVQYLVTVGREWWREKRAERKTEVQEIVSHLQALVKRLDDEKLELCRDIEAVQAEVRKLLEALARCKISATQRRAHIRYLESVLARNKLSFEAYVEETGDDATGTGTGTHSPLPGPTNPNPNPKPDTPGAA